jgi:hypothetical protein
MIDESRQTIAGDTTKEPTMERAVQQPKQCQETAADKPDSQPSAGRRPLFRH